LASDNTIEEFNLGIEANLNELLFPSSSSLVVRSVGNISQPGTFVYKALFIPPDTLAFIDGDNLSASANATIVVESVPEPGSLICVVSALGLGLAAARQFGGGLDGTACQPKTCRSAQWAETAHKGLLADRKMDRDRTPSERARRGPHRNRDRAAC